MLNKMSNQVSSSSSSNNNNNYNNEYIYTAQNRKTSGALVAADEQVFLQSLRKVCTERESIRSSRGKLFHTTAAETAISLVPNTDGNFCPAKHQCPCVGRPQVSPASNR